MKRLDFQPQAPLALAPQLSLHLSGELRQPVTVERACQLLSQGSVFSQKVRYRDPGPVPPGLALEIFWPDLPIVEFILDPGRVLWEDEHLLVVDKPAGVNSAPSPFSDIDCLTWGVQNYLANGFAVHAVHRLDRDTQGLMLFAKTKDAERGLHLLFRTRAIRKVYLAITPAVKGLGHKVFRWRDQLDFRGKVQEAATTALWSGSRDDGRWEWTVLAHTGRPHQIRRHFARYLVPLWGDRAYAQRAQVPGTTLGLACVGYRFRHPVTGVRLDLVRLRGFENGDATLQPEELEPERG